MDELQKMLMSQYGMNNELASSVAKNLTSSAQPRHLKPPTGEPPHPKLEGHTQQWNEKQGWHKPSGEDLFQTPNKHPAAPQRSPHMEHMRAVDRVFGPEAALRFNAGEEAGMEDMRQEQKLLKSITSKPQYPNVGLQAQQNIAVNRVMGPKWAETFNYGVNDGRMRASQYASALKRNKAH
jgi:hypothetical protein